METRVTRYKKTKINSMKKVKFLIGAVLLIGILGSGVSLAFAKQDVQSLLTNWFTSKRGAAVEEISDAIKNERDLQIDRIKEQLQQEIQQASQYLDSFTSAEKDKRTSNLRSYADELISSMGIDKAAGESNIQSELDSIYEDAIREMEKAVQSGVQGNTPQVPVPQPTPPPETESDAKPETEMENNTETETETESDSDNEPVIETEVETSPEPETDSESEGIIQDPSPQPEEGSDDRKGLDL